MTIFELIKHVNAGNFVAIIVFILSGIELCPKSVIKFSPLEWIGKRVNAYTLDRLCTVEKKLDEHIAQSYRNKILSAQSSILSGSAFTQEEFDEIVEACEAYEAYCKTNDIPNEKCKLAIGFLFRTYKQCQNNRTFANLPDGK